MAGKTCSATSWSIVSFVSPGRSWLKCSGCFDEVNGWGREKVSHVWASKFPSSQPMPTASDAEPTYRRCGPGPAASSTSCSRSPPAASGPSSGSSNPFATRAGGAAAVTALSSESRPGQPQSTGQSARCNPPATTVSAAPRTEGSGSSVRRGPVHCRQYCAWYPGLCSVVGVMRGR